MRKYGVCVWRTMTGFYLPNASSITYQTSILTLGLLPPCQTSTVFCQATPGKINRFHISCRHLQMTITWYLSPPPFYFKLDSTSSLEAQKPASEIIKSPQCQVYYPRFCFFFKKTKLPRNHTTLSVMVSNKGAIAPPLLLLTSGSNHAAKAINKQFSYLFVLDRIIHMINIHFFLLYYSLAK